MIIEGIDIKTNVLELTINNATLAKLQYCSIGDRPINIQYLFSEFAKQVNNILENGYYGKEKLKDAINEGRFIGYDRIYY